MIPSLLLAAAWSDRYGRRGVYMPALAAGRLESAIFPSIDTGSFLWICVSLAVGQMLVAMIYGPQTAFVSEMFSTEVRYFVASLGYQLGAILDDGFAPIIATALLAEYQDTIGISIFMAIACAFTLSSTWLLAKRRARGPRRRRRPEVTASRTCRRSCSRNVLSFPEKMSVTRGRRCGTASARIPLEHRALDLREEPRMVDTCQGPQGCGASAIVSSDCAAACRSRIRAGSCTPCGRAPARTSFAGTDRRRPGPRRSRVVPRDWTTTWSPLLSGRRKIVRAAVLDRSRGHAYEHYAAGTLHDRKRTGDRYFRCAVQRIRRAPLCCRGDLHGTPVADVVPRADEGHAEARPGATLVTAAWSTKL